MLSVKLPKGKYIIAVSGGVDSMVLLDILRRQQDISLVVAHFNHGIRKDAGEDEKLVHHYATSHNIEFTSKQIKLGSKASEEKARNERYRFLRHCRDRFKADFIVTAQHQDDLVETAIINLLRGTGWRGLAPFVATKDVLRPLINYKKKDLIEYARKHNVPWREDSTNQNTRYLRNYIRLDLLPRLVKKSRQFRQTLMRLIRKQQELRLEIEDQLDRLRDSKRPNSLKRHQLIMLPTEVSYELLQNFLHSVTGATAIRQLAENLLLFAKTGKPGKSLPINAAYRARLSSELLIVEPE